MAGARAPLCQPQPSAPSGSEKIRVGWDGRRRSWEGGLYASLFIWVRDFPTTRCALGIFRLRSGWPTVHAHPSETAPARRPGFLLDQTGVALPFRAPRETGHPPARLEQLPRAQLPDLGKTAATGSPDRSQCSPSGRPATDRWWVTRHESRGHGHKQLVLLGTLHSHDPQNGHLHRVCRLCDLPSGKRESAIRSRAPFELQPVAVREDFPVQEPETDDRQSMHPAPRESSRI